jgi:signal transduction histidine kinase
MNAIGEPTAWEAAFLCQLAHELRTPLSAVHGALGLLTSANPRTPESQAALLNMALRNADRLVRLVDDWVDLGALLSGCSLPACAELDPGAIVRETVELAYGDAESRGVTVSVMLRSTRRVRGDGARLARALRLALEGAVAAVTRDSLIAVSVEDDGDAGVAFAVDTPTFGMSIDQLECLMRDAASPGQLGRRFHEWPEGGHGGLRLPICSAIVTHLGGRIAASQLLDRTILRWTVPQAT